MIGYTIYFDRIDIINDDGSMGTIFLNQDSGKVFYRLKNGTISDVKHPGIYLGSDSLGIHFFLHNHYYNRRATLADENEYTEGNPIYLYDEKCSNTPFDVMQIGLNQVLNGERYNFLNYNCQTFTNQACHNQRKSADVEKWVKGLSIAGMVILGIGLLASE